MDVHKLSKVSEAKKVAIQYGRVTGISTCRKDSKVVFHMATILASHEAYAFDVSKGGPPEVALKLADLDLISCELR